MRLHNPQKTARFLKRFVRLDVEEVWALALDSELKLLRAEMIFRGTVSHCQLHARELFRFAISENAVHLILVHTHPSGDHQPSPEDLVVTERLYQVSRLVGIPLVEHLIISKSGFSSFAQMGFFKTWRRRKSVQL